MTIPTDATHEVSIHDLDHEARTHLYNARQSRDEYLDELEEIRSLLGAGPGVTALEAVTFLCERDAYLARVKDLESDVCKLAKERDEANMRHAHAKAERDGARRERDEAQAALAKANASLETERIAGLPLED